ncbi:hypothetical protein GQ55_6G064600 [Panicum hallii var. hallii]|uniref:Uncharacterized protein n=1 Tax=Panicum hallii var. hallii TaxID=1504633 RepID=A0A2T7D4J9_9POAL|nr:hypothetical protein GQ55_6G064600 [Panicum hallii var. hallii]
MTGFEPVTFCTQNKRATKLRYIPFQNCCTVSLYKTPVLFSTPYRPPPVHHLDSSPPAGGRTPGHRPQPAAGSRAANATPPAAGCRARAPHRLSARQPAHRHRRTSRALTGSPPSVCRAAARRWPLPRAARRSRPAWLRGRPSASLAALPLA